MQEGTAWVAMSLGDGRRDMRMRVVAGDLEIVETVVEDRVWLALDDQLRQRARRARQLQAGLFQVVRIQVQVTDRMHDLAHFQVALLSDHMSQERQARAIEGNAQVEVARALGQVGRQAAVGHVELVHDVVLLGAVISHRTLSADSVPVSIPYTPLLH